MNHPEPPTAPWQIVPHTHDPALYAQRRARLAAQLGPGGVAVLPTAPEHLRNRDSEFAFRHDSYFYYLSGFTEPRAWLVITAEGPTTLFCQPKDPAREIWDGIRLGPQAAVHQLGIDHAFTVDELDQRMPDLLQNRRVVWYPFATHSGLQTRISGWLDAVRSRARSGALCPHTLRDACAVLDDMRLIKDAHEQAIMRHAAHISAHAHIKAMQTSAAMLRAGHELREYHLEAELLHEFRRHGAQHPAYPSIVAGAANACVLHHRAGNTRIQGGDLVLIDAGCELDGYASDITRTFPAHGTFSPAQRALYDIVLAAQSAAIAATVPGAPFSSAHQAAVRVLTQGMLEVGLLDKNRVGTVDDAIENGHHLPYYMHRTGHWLGMDVHDCGSYAEPASEPDASVPLVTTATPSAPAPSRLLRPGMALTIEPGLYVRPGPDVPAAFWHIGIRIEDDAIVTASGCELISRDVPVKASDIEALMRA